MDAKRFKTFIKFNNEDLLDATAVYDSRVGQHLFNWNSIEMFPEQYSSYKPMTEQEFGKSMLDFETRLRAEVFYF